MTVAPDDSANCRENRRSPAIQSSKFEALVDDLESQIETKAAEYADQADDDVAVLEFLRDLLELRRGLVLGRGAAATTVEEKRSSLSVPSRASLGK